MCANTLVHMTLMAISLLFLTLFCIIYPDKVMSAFMALVWPEKEFLTRLRASDDSIPTKCIKLWLLFELLIPSRIFVLSFLSPFFFAMLFVCLGHLMNEWNVFVAFYLFWYFHIIVSGSVIWCVLKIFPAAKPRLDSFMYGADMTSAFWGNS